MYFNDKELVIWERYKDTINDEDDYNALSSAIGDTLQDDNLIGEYRFIIDENTGKSIGVDINRDTSVFLQDAVNLGITDNEYIDNKYIDNNIDEIYNDLKQYLEDQILIGYENNLRDYSTGDYYKRALKRRSKLNIKSYENENIIEYPEDRGLYVQETINTIDKIDIMFHNIKENNKVGEEDLYDLEYNLEMLKLFYNRLINMFDNKIVDLEGKNK